MVMFAWMFIEGFHLHNRLILNVFMSKPNYVVYNAVGWGKSISHHHRRKSYRTLTAGKLRTVVRYRVGHSSRQPSPSRNPPPPAAVG